MQKLHLITFFIALVTLSGCMSDAGIKISNMMHQKEQLMYTSEAYGDLDVNEEVANSYKDFLGEYIVKESWDNGTFHITKVIIEEKNNKINVYTYPEGWQIPNQKTEFVKCQVVGPTDEEEFGFNYTEQAFLCVSNTASFFKGFGSFEIIKSTDSTIAKVDTSTGFIDVLLPDYEVKIVTPYAINLDLWSDSKPYLAVEKVK